MSTRADLEAAFATAEADLAKAARDLTKANADHAETKADLPKAFSNLARASAGLAKAEADLAKARASCLTARTALARLNLAEGRPSAYRSERRRAAGAAAPERARSDRRKASEDWRLAGPGLSDLNRAELVVNSNGWTDKVMKGAVNGSKPGTTASPSGRDTSPRSTQSSEHLVCAVEAPAARQPGPRKEYRRFICHFSAQEAGTRDVQTWQSLAWQTVQLSSLALAYLQYYFIDVNLQIATLRSVGILLAV